MELLLNTSNPLTILLVVAVMALIIYTSKKFEIEWPLIILMIGIVGYLIYHSVRLDSLEKGSAQLSEVYHCIAFDLIFMLVAFISFLWVDDLVAKKKKLKSYDDSLSWFWNKL